MKTVLTDAEIRDAVFVDFEGRTDRAPILLGVRWPTGGGQGTVDQFVLDTRFAPAAAAHGLTVCTIEEAVAAIVRHAEAEECHIVGWSGHEIEVVETYCSAILARRFVERHVDGKAAAKVARRRLAVELPPARGRERGHALGRYLRLIDFDVPFPFGPGWTGKTIRVLDASFSRGDDWASLTPHRKRRWSFLLSHNGADLDGTAAVTAWAAQAIATPGRPTA